MAIRIAMLLAMLTATTALARPGGIASGQFPVLASGCNAAQCHNGGQPPAVDLMGPTSVAAGDTAIFTFTVGHVGAQDAAGLNVRASAGILAPGGADSAGTRTVLQSGRAEITHVAPKTDPGPATRFSFVWTAPAQAGAVVLTAWGNAVNRNGNPSGDRAASDALTVQVVGGGPTTTTVPTSTSTTLAGVTSTTTSGQPTTTAPGQPTSTTGIGATSTSSTEPPAGGTTTTTLEPLPVDACAAPIVVAGLRLTVRGLAGTAGNESVVLRGRLPLAAGAPIDPTGRVRLVMDDLGVTAPVLDRELASGGRGAGVRVRDRRARGKGLVVSVRIAGATLPALVGPWRITLLLGSDADGVCATRTFDAGACRRSRNTLRCR